MPDPDSKSSQEHPTVNASPTPAGHDSPTLDIPVRVELSSGDPSSDADTTLVAAASPGATPPGRPSVRPSVGRYQVGELIGEGGMGVVYRAFDRDLRRQVAMKVLKREMVAHPEVAERFVEEAQATSQLQHPGIVPVYEIGFDDEGRLFFTMKLVEGRTLAKIIAARHQEPSSEGAPSWYRLLAVFVEVARTVAYAHERGVVHRDLKPQNIMVGAYGEVQVMDWGLAKVLSGPEPERTETPAPVETNTRHATAYGAIIGTPAYMAPEQASGDPARVGRPADGYALGVILYQILTGQAPYRAGSHDEVLVKLLAGPPRPPRSVRRQAPKELDAICRRAMAREPEARYPSAQALADDVQRFLEGKPVEAHPDGPVKQAWKWVRRHRAITLTAALILAAVLLGGAVFAGFWYQQRVTVPLASSPAGSAVWLDGELAGHTPMEVTLGPGSYQIRMVQDEHKPILRRVDVAWGQARWDTTERIAHEPAFEICTFTSDPAAARLVVTDTVTGTQVAQATTPATFKLPVGSYRLQWSKAGYLPREQGFTVAGSTEPRPLDAQLEENTGTVVFTGDVALTTVEVYPPPYRLTEAPLRVGAAAEVLELPAGRWHLRLVRGGVVDSHHEVDVTVGEQTAIEVEATLPHWVFGLSDSRRLGDVMRVSLDGRPPFQLLVSGGKQQLLALDASGITRFSAAMEDIKQVVPADLNGDGATETLVGTGEQLLVLDGEGEPRWQAPALGFAPPADLLPDAGMEVVAVEPGNDGEEPQVVCRDARGQRRWRVPIGKPLDLPAVVSLQVPMILQVHADPDGQVRLTCVERSGEVRWNLPVAGQSVAVEPLPEADQLAVLIRPQLFQPGRLVGLTPDGGQAWTLADARVDALLLAEDLDGDGREEVVCRVGPELVCSVAGRVRWRLHTRSAVRGIRVARLHPDQPPVLLCRQPGGLEAVSMAGSRAWHWETEGELLSRLRLVDLDGDGAMEVVGSTDQALFCLTPEGEVRWQVAAPVNPSELAVVEQGDERAVVVGCTDGWALALDRDGRVRWSYKAGARVNYIRVDDLEEDGTLEAFVLDDQARLHCVPLSNQPHPLARLVGDHGVIPGLARTGQGGWEVWAQVSEGVVVLDRSGALRWRSPVEARHDKGVDRLDLDGDGRLETLIMGEDQLLCLDEGGGKQWTRPVREGRFAVAPPDGDGRRDILVLDKGHLKRLAPSGTLRWSAPLHPPPHTSLPSVAAPPLLLVGLDEEAGFEVLVSLMNGDIQCYDGEGSLRWNWSGGKGYPFVSSVLPGPNGNLLLIGSDDGWVACLSREGRPVWELDLELPGLAVIPLAADLDGDGMDEVVVASEHQHLLALDQNGAIRWRRAYPGSPVLPHLADLDGDGAVEVLFGLQDGRLLCLDGEGTVRWWRQTVPKGVRVLRVADVDGDGRLEVLAHNKQLLCLEEDGAPRWRALAAGMLLPLAGPVGLDGDGDGHLEIYAGDYDGRLHVIEDRPPARVLRSE